MGLFGKSKPKLDLAPDYPEGPDALAADGKLAEREVAYLAKLAAAGIALRALRDMTFLFVYDHEAAAAEVIRRFEGHKFDSTVVPEGNGRDAGAFMLSCRSFSLDPELSQWAKQLRSVDNRDVTYMGWVVAFPEVSRRRVETFFRGRQITEAQSTGRLDV